MHESCKNGWYWWVHAPVVLFWALLSQMSLNSGASSRFYNYWGYEPIDSPFYLTWPASSSTRPILKLGSFKKAISSIVLRQEFCQDMCCWDLWFWATPKSKLLFFGQNSTKQIPSFSFTSCIPAHTVTAGYQVWRLWWAFTRHWHGPGHPEKDWDVWNWTRKNTKAWNNM